MEENQMKQATIKKRPKFKALDVVIILLVLLAILGWFFRYSTLDFLENNLNKKDYTIQFSIRNIRYTTPDHLLVGDQVYLSDSGEQIGTLVAQSGKNRAVIPTAASEYVVDEAGNVVEIFYPENTRVDAEGTMVCEGLYTSDGTFLLNGTTHLAAGKELRVQTERVSVTIIVEKIEEIEQK